MRSPSDKTTADDATVTNELQSPLHKNQPPIPGLVIVFAAGQPIVRTLAIGRDPMVLGRESMPGPTDSMMSRRHARVARQDDRWTVEDLGSHNGSWVDGRPLAAPVVATDLRTLRIGQTVCLLEADIRPFVGLEVAAGEHTMGHRLRAIWRLLDQLGTQPTLHIHGESGSGKELAARAFHDRGARKDGPFVAVNCAAIPTTLAEAMLFGARKGAFSGADRDTEGLFPAADGGTLFLDEIGELELPLQAKLLRVLETREVLAVGASRPRTIDVRVCSASHRELKVLVAQGRFREDLYFRLGRPEIALPPLRERREEIPTLVCRSVAAVDPALAVDASLIEACLLRGWPGNVRELLVEARSAAQLASADKEPRVASTHLDEDAGIATKSSRELDDRAPEQTGEPAEMPSRETILDAIRRSNGRVAPAARLLDIPRIRLRRWLEREGLDPATLR